MTTYLFPASITEALDALHAHAGQARILAGGTDVMLDLREKKIAPRCLVDITRIPELNHIQVGEVFVQVGAAVTFARLQEDPYLKREVPALVEAARAVGALGIQNAATWVGNIVQAMPAADGAIVALALDAQACVVDPAGQTWRPVASLFEGPGRSAIDPTRQLVTHLRFPRPRPGWGTAWRRVGRRPSLTLPVLNCAARLCLDEGRERVVEAALALGPVAPRPFRAAEAEAYLVGQAPEPAIFVRAAELARQAANPRSSIMRASREYRLQIIPVLVAEALSVAAERAVQGPTTTLDPV